MSRLQKIVVACLVFLACCLTCSGTSEATHEFPEWEGTWFKLKVDFKQCEYRHAKSKWGMSRGKRHVYLLFDHYRGDDSGDPNDPGVVAAPMVLWETDDDTGQGYWEMLHWELAVMPAPDDATDFLVFGLHEREEDEGENDDEAAILAFTGRIRGRVNPVTGVLKKATFKSFGGLIVGQHNQEYEAGGFKLKGKAVPASRLPFPWPLQQQ